MSSAPSTPFSWMVPLAVTVAIGAIGALEAYRAAELGRILTSIENIRVSIQHNSIAIARIEQVIKEKKWLSD